MPIKGSLIAVKIVTGFTEGFSLPDLRARKKQEILVSLHVDKRNATPRKVRAQEGGFPLVTCVKYACKST